MNSRPKLLDLFCGAGGAAVGYHRAGFDVVGVDIKPQPNYPYEFHQADAISYAGAHGWKFDAIHASPPCQTHSQLKALHSATDYNERHLDLIPQTRWLALSLGVPYVIENVMGAKPVLRNPIKLCGTQFGLKVYRHRLFESNVMLLQPAHYPHRDNTPRNGGRTSSKGFVTVAGHFAFSDVPDSLAYAQMAMGIGWMTKAELAQSIPPAFTEYIGRQLLRCVQRQAVSA